VKPQRPSDFRSIDRLPAALRDVHGRGDLYHGGGCSPHQSWTALFDRASNRIWIEVMYPDWGGDDPACYFPNAEKLSAVLEGHQTP
jgi:hypothetical protein